jgi:general secretion pathway protein K
MLRRPPPPAVSRDGGFALIIVLWTLVLIGFIIAHVTASGRTEIRIASNLVANSEAQAAADGAIFEAIFNLSDPQPDQRWPVGATPRQIVVGSSRVVVRLEDEASWINPSTG